METYIPLIFATKATGHKVLYSIALNNPFLPSCLCVLVAGSIAMNASITKIGKT